MTAWNEMIIGTLEVCPELEVLVNLIGVCLMLEIMSLAFALLGSFKRL